MAKGLTHRGLDIVAGPIGIHHSDRADRAMTGVAQLGDNAEPSLVLLDLKQRRPSGHHAEIVVPRRLSLFAPQRAARGRALRSRIRRNSRRSIINRCKAVTPSHIS